MRSTIHGVTTSSGSVDGHPQEIRPLLPTPTITTTVMAAILL